MARRTSKRPKVIGTNTLGKVKFKVANVGQDQVDILLHEADRKRLEEKGAPVYLLTNIKGNARRVMTIVLGAVGEIPT